MLTCAREYPIIIQNGDEIIHEITVTEFRGKCAYAIKVGKAHYRVISKEKFNAIMKEAEANGYYIFDYGTFD